ncbi:MAG: CoA pyrophosphatase, partial [candidate division Zixibacteria bacterium]|nr:CoA pyrophosphatase [candidate division Zixibacteria bacterium]
MKWLDVVQKSLSRRSPVLLPTGRKRAAVALVVYEDVDGASVLYILRARREGDPWSGHIAFPGGRIEDTDAGPQETAERETLEEIGLDLRAGRCLGRLDDLTTQLDSLHVAGFVYSLAAKPVLNRSPEVLSAFWFPVTRLLEPKRQGETVVRGEFANRSAPAIDLLG